MILTVTADDGGSLFLVICSCVACFSLGWMLGKL
jgi:hypothetical protein